MLGPTAPERRRLFEGHAIFGKLPTEDLDALLSHARVEHYPAGREIFAKGSPGRSMLAIVRGTVRIEVGSRITAYEGRTFGDYGPYERIAGVAHLRIDPNAPANRGIVDLAQAPRAADGMVDYDVDVVILRPQNGAKARRLLLYEVVNRGMKLLSMFTGGSPMGAADPIDPGDGLLLRQGYTLIVHCWDNEGNATMASVRFKRTG